MIGFFYIYFFIFLRVYKSVIIFFKIYIFFRNTLK